MPEGRILNAEGRILSEDTTYSIPAMQGNIGLLCSKIQVNSTYGTYSFVGPQALVRPLLCSGQYNRDLQVSENYRSLCLVT